MGLYDKRLGSVNIDKGGTVYNVKHADFAGGAKGDGVANDRAAFVALEAFVDANLESLKSGYVPTGLYIIGSSLTLSKAWEFAYGAKLQPASGVTITINGSFSAGLYQVFDLSAGGSVVLGTNAVAKLSPEWWGAVGDCVAGAGTDNTAAIAATITCGNSGGVKHIQFTPSNYLTGDQTITEDGFVLEGSASAYQYSSVIAYGTRLTAKVGTTVVLNLAPTGGAIEDPTLCQIRHIHVDGLLRASYGIRSTNATLYDDVSVRGTLSAGIHLTNFTNGTHLFRCAGNDNFNYGLYVSGASTTTFSVSKSNFTLNQLDGILLQAGEMVTMTDVVIESNGWSGLRMLRPNGGGSMGNMTFTNVWFEGNGASAPFLDSLDIDCSTRSEANAIYHLVFEQCRFNPGGNTRRFMLLQCAKDVEFRRCRFHNSTLTAALGMGADAYRISFIDSQDWDSESVRNAQLTDAWSTVNRMWFSDSKTRFVPTLINSWVNFGAGFPEAKYWHDAQGNVCVQGRVKTGTIGTVICTLPPGFRPTTTWRFQCPSNGAYGEVEVQPDGDVVATVGSNVAVDFGMIRFSVTA